jgi:hypothetical protein
MAFPKTLDELIQAGYQRFGEGVCRGCSQRMEWWITPKRKKIPLNPTSPDAPVSPHHATCSHVEQFRKRSEA